MKNIVITILFTLSTSLWAKINMSQFKDSVKLGEQIVSIDKAEIIVNKMPGPGSKKPSKYIVITLKTNDGQKINETYKIVLVSFPGCTRRFSQKVTEKRGDGCVVRDLPDWARKGTLVALTLEDKNGVKTSIKALATEIEVH